MFEDNEKEVVEAEETNEIEVKEEAKEEKNDTSNTNGGTKYHLIRENFNPALKFAIIGAGIETVVWILTAIFDAIIDNNAINIINSVIFAAGCGALIFVGVVELNLFRNKTNAKRNEDLASFLISLIAFILCFLSALWFGIDAIQSLVWFFRGL